MKGTKDKIRETALHLFNEQGLSETALRDIASSLQISPGNLTYHYRHKEDLIEALYFELVEKLDVQLRMNANAEDMLEWVIRVNAHFMRLLYAYRFFLRDLYLIMGAYGSIRTHYQELQQRRTREFLQIFDLLIEQGLMRPPEFEQEYERLYERMNILGDNWINAMKLLNSRLDNPVVYYSGLLLESLYPYLTKTGKTRLLESQDRLL